jgi:hypothetical protein
MLLAFAAAAVGHAQDSGRAKDAMRGDSATAQAPAQPPLCDIGWGASAKRPINPACEYVYLTRMLAVPSNFPPEGITAEIVDPGTRCYSPIYRLKVPVARVAEIEKLLDTMPGFIRFCADTKF